MRKVAIFASLTIVVISCLAYLGSFAPRDTNGERPFDIFQGFLNAVNKHDYEAARSFCTSESIVGIETSFATSFEEFCKEKFECDSYSLSDFKREKSGSYSARFSGANNENEVKSFRLAAMRVSGVWKLVFPFR